MSVAEDIVFEEREHTDKLKGYNKMDDREPLKLLTEISYLDNDIWAEIRLETRHANRVGYVFVEGTAGHIKDHLNMFKDYYVERILYDEDEHGERHLLIHAVKEKTK